MIDNLELIWTEEHGMGFFPVEEWLKEQGKSLSEIYDQDYFDRYAEYEGSEVSEKLNAFRAKLALEVAGESGAILDVGIGSGEFIQTIKRLEPGQPIFGYDVNPAGVKWLEDNDLFKEMYDITARYEFKVFTYWDSLEHIRDLSLAFEASPEYIIVSCPVYQDEADVLQSKHFRKDEHFWYWTDSGFVEFAKRMGYNCVSKHDDESKIGRESIITYVLRRGE